MGTIRCLIKRGTTEDYKKHNPVLHFNELAVEYNDDKIVGYKIGDGVTQWSDLLYITKITDISEFWLYCSEFGSLYPYVVAKIVLDPFVINDFLGGAER